MSKVADEQFRRLFENVPGLFLVLDPTLHIIAVSNAYLDATLTQRQDITGKYIFDVFPDNPDDENATGVSNLHQSLNTVLQQGKPHRMPDQKYDIRRPDGSFEVRYWSPLNTPILSDKGEVEYIIHRAEDVTELVLMREEDSKQVRKFEDKLRQLNIELREELKKKTAELVNIFERITDGFIALDKNFCYIYVNKKVGEMTNRDPTSLIGKNVWDEFPDAVGTETYAAFTKAMRDQVYIRNEDYYAPLNLWQENHIYPSPDGLSVFIRDISVRKQAEEQLKASHEELQLLTSHLLDVKEEERQRISREIHDELGQLVTAIKMDMLWIRKKMNTDDSSEKIAEKIEMINHMLDEAVVFVRRISSELRPRILDDFGLVAALDWQSKEFEKRFSIPVYFTEPKEWVELPADIATGLFRMFQESLTNVARHSAAKHVSASVMAENNAVTLTIADDGRGFDINTVVGKKTLGLLGMKERAAIMHGQLNIMSTPGKGTTVTVTVPVSG